MRTRSIGRTLLAAAATGILAVTTAGCAMLPERPDAQRDPETSSPATTPRETSEAPHGDTLLLRALGEITGPTGGYVEFGDTAALRELSGGNFAGTWGGVRGMGMSSIASYWLQLEDTIGIDPDAADYAIAVAQPPGVKTLIVGGQDETAIRAAAEAAGWQGDPVLSSELNMAQPLSVSVADISPAGSDVLLAGRGAESGRGPASDEEPIRELAACLGDVVAAMFSDGVAIGVRADADGAPVAVYCLAGDDRDAADLEEAFAGDSPYTGQPYADLFPEREFEVADGHVRAELSGGDPADRIFALLIRRDLPGVGA